MRRRSKEGAKALADGGESLRRVVRRVTDATTEALLSLLFPLSCTPPGIQFADSLSEAHTYDNIASPRHITTYDVHLVHTNASEPSYLDNTLSRDATLCQLSSTKSAYLVLHLTLAPAQLNDHHSSIYLSLLVA